MKSKSLKVGIQIPGKVKNVEKAIQMLGGRHQIAKAVRKADTKIREARQIYLEKQ